MKKSKYEKAFDKACALLRDGIDCGGGCPFIKSGKCGDVACDEKKTWKEYILKEVQEND